MVNPVCFKMHIAYSSIIHPWNLSNSFNSWSKTNCRWRGQRGEHLATIHDKIVQKKNVYLSRSNHIYIWATIRICHTHLYMKRTSEAVGPRNDGALTGTSSVASVTPQQNPLWRRTFVKYRLPCLSSYKPDRKTKACDELMAWTPCTTSNMVEFSLASTEGAGWCVWVGKKYWRQFWDFCTFFFAFHIFPPFFGTSQNSYQVVTVVTPSTPSKPVRWAVVRCLDGIRSLCLSRWKGRKDVKGRSM